MKITGVKKTAGEIKNSSHMHHIVYLDRSTGKVWADFYADGNSWTQYHDEAITSLHGYYRDYMGDAVSMTQRITDAAQAAMEEYND